MANNSIVSLKNKLKDATDDDVFLFLLWRDNCIFNNKTYTFVNEKAKRGCSSGVILATYFDGKLYTKTNLGCIWNEHTEDGKLQPVLVNETYPSNELNVIANDCSAVIKLASNANDKTNKLGSTFTIKNYLLDKYVKGFNEMLLYAEEVKKNFTNSFKAAYENAQKAFDNIDAQYKANELSKEDSKAYENQLKAINSIISSLEEFYLRLTSDKTVAVASEHDYTESLVTEAAGNRSRIDSGKIKVINAKKKISKNKANTATTPEQDKANINKQINQTNNLANQVETETKKTVLQASALTKLPGFISKCVKTWKRINLYYNREATIRTVASNDPSILLEYENIFNQFPSEKLYNSEQALEALYNDLYKPNGIIGLLRKLYEISKSEKFKFIWANVDGKKKKLSDIRLDDKDKDPNEIHSIIKSALENYVSNIESLKELSELNALLEEFDEKYFKDGQPLSNTYFEAQNKILKDIEERISKRVGTTATVKSVDATNANVTNH